AAMVVLAAILYFVWPVVYSWLVSFGTAISSLGAAGAGLYGFFNRLLIPTGLHHALNSVFWFRSEERRVGKGWRSGCASYQQAEDGIRDRNVTGVQTCALPISAAMVVLAAILYFVWPVVYSWLVSFGTAISSLGAAGAGLYGFFNRLLIPTGLHHALNSVFWF